MSELLEEKTIDFQIIKGFFDGLKPILTIKVSEWADKFRFLSPLASAEPGPYNSSRTPYLREIMDKLSETDPTQIVIFEKGAQVGATEAGCNWIGYIIDVSPGPLMMVMPTDDTMKRNTRIRIDPMIDASPTLREKVAEPRSRDNTNTISSKSFPGGIMIMTGSNSPAPLRSMPVKYLYLDEVDEYPLDVGEQGSPIALAKARQRTFAKRKCFMTSTPTIEGASVIDSEYKKTDQRKYFVPCPFCGLMQELKFANLKWDEGNPESAKYKCDSCDKLIEERYKTAMLANGKWEVTCAENVSSLKAGYHLNSLYSPYGWYSWVEAATDYLRTKDDINEEKTFVNTVLGETFKLKGEAPPWETVYNKRENYALNIPPDGCAFITAGVDVQKDRVEVEVVGWCSQKISWSLDYRILMGDTSEKEVWNKLSGMLDESWIRPDGGVMKIRMMCIDTGYNTQYVYDFCHRYDQTRVIPIKGKENQDMAISSPKMVDVTQAGKKTGNVKLWMVGVSIIKSEFYGLLKLQIGEDKIVPTGYCHFPEYGEGYFKGLTAEDLQFHIVHGYRKYQWVKKYERNEPLDCRVYARAAAHILQFDRMSEKYIDELAKSYIITPAEKAPQPKKNDSFWRNDEKKKSFWD